MHILGISWHQDDYVFQFIVFLQKGVMKLPPQVRASMYRYIMRRGSSHNPFKSMFYWALIYDSCIVLIYDSCVYQVYVCHIHSAGLFLFSCTLLALPGLISAAGRFRPGLSPDTFCLDHRKSIDSRLSSAKVPESRWWSHKHSCPGMFPGLHRLQTQI